MDSFFALGGDSLLGIRLRNVLERHRLTFTVAELYRSPTIRELVGKLRPLDSPAGAPARTEPKELVRPQDLPLLPADVEDAYPLSAMQSGIVFHAEYDSEAEYDGEDGDSAVYRVVTSIRVGAGFDLAVLRRAVDDTVRRHPALRTSYHLAGYSEPLQLVHAEVEVPIEVADDIGALPDAEQRQAVRAWVGRAKYRRFDLTRPPLLAFTVHPAGSGSFQLSVVEHHVVLDGWSDALMLDEIVARYWALVAGEELWLPAVAATFRDFVAHERWELADERHRAFWTGVLAGVDPAPLPRMTADPPAGRPAHREVEVPVPAEVLTSVQELARREGLPLKAMMAAAHVAALGLVTGSAEAVTGLVTHGRLEEPDGDEVVGVFLNTLPVRVPVRGASLLGIARRVFEQEQAAMPHRRYPYAQIQRDLDGTLALDSYLNPSPARRTSGTCSGSEWPSGARRRPSRCSATPMAARRRRR
jgi:Condensation domain/Phosphopantetheine attachment site